MGAIISKELRDEIMAGMAEREPRVREGLTKMYTEACKRMVRSGTLKASPEKIQAIVAAKVERILN